MPGRPSGKVFAQKYLSLIGNNLQPCAGGTICKDGFTAQFRHPEKTTFIPRAAPSASNWFLQARSAVTAPKLRVKTSRYRGSLPGVEEKVSQSSGSLPKARVSAPEAPGSGNMASGKHSRNSWKFNPGSGKHSQGLGKGVPRPWKASSAHPEKSSFTICLLLLHPRIYCRLGGESSHSPKSSLRMTGRSGTSAEALAMPCRGYGIRHAQQKIPQGDP
jgi:hypothetical protein